MPFETGTGAIGFQKIIEMPISLEKYLILRPPDVPVFGRTERVGTVLVVSQPSTGLFPTTAVYKLYGHGLSVRDVGWDNQDSLEVWVNWFVSGFAWYAETADE